MIVMCAPELIDDPEYYNVVTQTGTIEVSKGFSGVRIENPNDIVEFTSRVHPNVVGIGPDVGWYLGNAYYTIRVAVRRPGDAWSSYEDMTTANVSAINALVTGLPPHPSDSVQFKWEVKFINNHATISGLRRQLVHCWMDVILSGALFPFERPEWMDESPWDQPLANHTKPETFGAFVQSLGGTDNAAIAAAVWAALTSENNTSGSFGEAAQAAAPTVPTAGEVADAVWDEAIADHTTSGSFGEAAQEAAPTTEQIADAVWDEVLTGATHNIPTSAGRRLRQANALVAAEGRITTLNTVGSFGTDLTSAVDEFYDDHTFVFTSGDLTGQARVITGYDGTTKRVTFDENWTSAPAEDDEFIIFADHELTRDQVANSVVTKLLSDGVSLEETILRVRRHLTNKLVTDPVTGVASLYSDDGLAVDETSQMYEDSAGTQTYQGEGAERREGFEDAP
jgi:hypothetical protein